mmetsp:Transcript_49145/g.107089  ORF Transcript_49145/g.107089 Transcript_49145/m.107089 type:complete len:245 (+) Transcript_49145:268-1002(+)
MSALPQSWPAPATTLTWHRRWSPSAAPVAPASTHWVWPASNDPDGADTELVASTSSTSKLIRNPPWLLTHKYRTAVLCTGLGPGGSTGCGAVQLMLGSYLARKGQYPFTAFSILVCFCWRSLLFTKDGVRKWATEVRVMWTGAGSSFTEAIHLVTSGTRSPPTLKEELAEMECTTAAILRVSADEFRENPAFTSPAYLIPASTLIWSSSIETYRFHSKDICHPQRPPAISDVMTWVPNRLRKVM